jgi:hypothetical protein
MITNQVIPLGNADPGRSQAEPPPGSGVHPQVLASSGYPDIGLAQLCDRGGAHEDGGNDRGHHDVHAVRQWRANRRRGGGFFPSTGG